MAICPIHIAHVVVAFEGHEIINSARGNGAAPSCNIHLHLRGNVSVVQVERDDACNRPPTPDRDEDVFPTPCSCSPFQDALVKSLDLQFFSGSALLIAQKHVTPGIVGNPLWTLRIPDHASSRLFQLSPKESEEYGQQIVHDSSNHQEAPSLARTRSTEASCI